ncbi:MAG: HNH endonuclease [Pseudoramibacter sp.]
MGKYDKIKYHLYLEGLDKICLRYVEWLSCGGEDSIDNVVALCPNCHRRIHIFNDADDNMRLKKKLKLYH